MCIEQLRAFEGLNSSEQIDKVCEELIKAGFVPTEVVSSKKTINIHYTKDDCNLVLTVIKDGNLKQAVVYDKFVFDEFIYDEQAGKKKRTITLKDRHDTSKGYVPHIASSGGLNITLHRLLMGAVSGGKQVDHISHNLAICTKDFLRLCTAQQNKFNTKQYSKINEEDRTFTAPCKNLSSDMRNDYCLKGYSIKRNHITSPSFNSRFELYRAVKDFEDRYMGEFRYRPLYDFSETFYAFVAWKMLKWVTEVDITEYNRDFLLRNHPEMAEYYQLGE